MFNANRRLVRAKEESAKALLRSAGAKQQIASALRKLINEEDEPPRPPEGSPPKNQPPRK